MTDDLTTPVTDAAAAPAAQPAQPIETGESMPATEPDPVRAVPVTPAARPNRASLWINALLGLALAVAIGGVAFAAGRLTAPASAAGANGGRVFTGAGPGGNVPGGGYFGRGGNGGALAGGGAAIQGTVTAVTATSITITTASGQSIEIALDGTTTYHQQASASASDVTTGGTVIVRLGLRQPDGSGTATGPTASDVTIVP